MFVADMTSLTRRHAVVRLQPHIRRRQNLDRVDDGGDQTSDQVYEAGHWATDLSHDAASAALQRHNVRDIAVEVDRCWREGQDFGNPAAA